MPSTGPQLPSQADKRKHDSDDSSSEDDYGPAMPSVSQKRKSPSPESAPKRVRTIGPTLPPANLDERPPNPPDEDDDSSEDDGFGPALPSTTDRKTSYTQSTDEPPQKPVSDPQTASKLTRDEWMVIPPSSGDWSSRVDPTKLKNRRFNAGKSARGGSHASSSDNAKWTETPAEKAARLQREMMGIEEKSTARSKPQTDAQSEATAKKLREYNEKVRGTSLYSEHQKSNPTEKEDDPSARAFDREKDIAGGLQINHTQRKELLKRAADFGSKFSSGNYL